MNNKTEVMNNVDKLILVLTHQVFGQNLNLSNSEEVSKVRAQIIALPNSRIEKETLMEEFEIQTGIHQIGYEANPSKELLQQMKESGYQPTFEIQ
jgi:hypothetical protein